VNMQQQQRRVRRSAAAAADVGRVPVPWHAGPLTEGYQVGAAHSSAVRCIHCVWSNPLAKVVVHCSCAHVNCQLLDAMCCCVHLCAHAPPSVCPI
jgi:hypothetical protein